MNLAFLQVMDEFVKPASKDAGQGLEGTVDELSEKVSYFFYLWSSSPMGNKSKTSTGAWWVCRTFGHLAVGNTATEISCPADECTLLVTHTWPMVLGCICS